MNELIHPESSSDKASPLQDISVDNWREKLWDYVATNSLFSAGAGLMAITIAGAYARKALIMGRSLFTRRFVATISLDNNDPAYQWVLDYINKHSRSPTNKLTVNTFLEQSESGRLRTRFLFMPGRCDHYFRFGPLGRFIKVSRTRERQTLQQSDGTRQALETVTLTTLAPSMSAGARFWPHFLQKATKEALSNVETGLVIYRAVGPEWRRFGQPRRKRPLDSIVLDTGVKESLTRDLEEFFASSEWYKNRGIPYRRGYLLHGPHGTGKSSFISALAGNYGYSICMLTMSDRLLDDDRLVYLMNTLPRNSFLLLEDIDAATSSHGHSTQDDVQTQHPAYQGLQRVTFSGLTNALDGVASGEERIIFMTTNRYSSLNKGLIRPGRVDIQQEFGNCTAKMLEEMFAKFYEGVEGVGEKEAGEFRARCESEVDLGSLGISPAHVQGHLLLYKSQPDEAIKRVGDLLDTVRAEGKAQRSKMDAERS